MNYSAQAIIVDEDRNIYLEDNKVIGALSFIGGKFEEGENEYLDVVVREVKEELGIVLNKDRFLDGELQAVRIFSGKEYTSMYYVCVLTNKEVLKIKNTAKIDLQTFDFTELERLDDTDFPIERVSFLQQVQRALDKIY